MLDAAWAELAEHGYAAFTLEATKRAGTSKPVIYRRWANKALMVKAAIAHASSAHTVEVPNTGSLRGNFIAKMHTANTSRIDLLVAAVVLLDGYFTETGSNPEHLRERILASHHSAAETVVERAVQRGEADAALVLVECLAIFHN
ncbi:TetR/AcrR family transcriptional regulator [Streptomyces adustus]